MMRPMKLAGQELLFGEGCLEHIKTLCYRRVFIVIGGNSVRRNGMLQRVQELFHQTGAETEVFSGVESDPHFATVRRGAEVMLDYKPDLIVALGGGSCMDAAKAMWVYYEHPEMKKLEELLEAKPFPKLRQKAHFMCLPTTSGSASEVSRSIVISDDMRGLKHGLGNMEMMPDIALVDPELCRTMPPKLTAETGMDALTHALEAYVSTRANYLSDILASAAVRDIIRYLPLAVADGQDMEARTMMANASMTAGLAFTNVSLGIVHSMAQTIAGFFPVSHGLIDAVLLPYVLRFNSRDLRAKARYSQLAEQLGVSDLITLVEDLNHKLGIPHRSSELFPDRSAYYAALPEMAERSLQDGCTKTNPIIPTVPEFMDLLRQSYEGLEGEKRCN